MAEGQSKGIRGSERDIYYYILLYLYNLYAEEDLTVGVAYQSGEHVCHVH